MRLTTVFLALLVLPGVLTAQEEVLPAPVQLGADTLLSGDYTAAVDLWSETWTDPADVGKGDQLRAGMARLFAQIGDPQGYEVLRVTRLGSRLQRIYMVFFHKRQPVFAFFATYKIGNRWTVTDVNFNTDDEQVVPTDMLEGWEREP